MTLFKKVPVSERLPESKHHNITYFIVGWADGHFDKAFIHNNGKFIQTLVSSHQTVNREFEKQPDWWLEVVEFPNKEEITNASLEWHTLTTYKDADLGSFRRGINWLKERLGL